MRGELDMSRISCRRILVVVALLALTVVPMASARTVDSTAVSRGHDGNWLGVALRWVEGFVNPRQTADRPGSMGSRDPQTKGGGGSGGNTTNGGSCIDPAGHTNPWCSPA
jgi:hypothetical protein